MYLIQAERQAEHAEFRDHSLKQGGKTTHWPTAWEYSRLTKIVGPLCVHMILHLVHMHVIFAENLVLFSRKIVRRKSAFQSNILVQFNFSIFSHRPLFR